MYCPSCGWEINLVNHQNQSLIYFVKRDSFLQLRPFFDRLFRGCIAIEARRRWVPGSDRFQLVVILEKDLLSLVSPT